MVFFQMLFKLCFKLRCDRILIPILCLLLVVLSVGGPLVARAQEPVHTFVVDDYPPYYAWKNGKPVGVWINVVNEAFRRMGIRSKFIKGSWVRSLKEMEEGRVAGTMGGLKTPQREKYSLYPEESLGPLDCWIISLRESPYEYKSLDDLRGRVVGVNTSYTYGSEFDEMQGLDVIDVEHEEQLIKLLVSRRVDAILGSKLVFEHIGALLGVADQLDFRTMIFEGQYYLMFSKKYADSEELAVQFSKAIRSMRADGTLGNFSGK